MNSASASNCVNSTIITYMDMCNNTNITGDKEEEIKCLGVAPIHPSVLIIYIIVNIVFHLTATFSNGLFLLVMCKKKMKLSPTGILVMNLTIADLFNGLILVPMMMYTRYFVPLYDQWGILYDKEETQRALCFVPLLLGTITYVVSFTLLAAISLERFVGMMLYKSLDKKRAKIKAIFGGIIIWIYVSVLLIALFPKSFKYEQNLGCHLTLSVSSSLRDILKPHLVIPLILCIIFYTAIFFTIKKHRRTVNIETHNNPVNNMTHIHEARWVMTIFLVIVVFCGTWVPYYIATAYIDHEECMVSWKKNVLYSTSTLAHISSVINPWIYTYRHAVYRKQVRKYVQKIRQFKCCTTQDS
ncbi:unnamed protein product [Owenia fusiformis]|uniref:Uncharacterized protein n=1 Tax=Owenia fusiformis TaxID=6347 RepID=A0A8J1UDR3_OWEFU|nr:unnamed protein product [Owenia fusiformis]